MVGMFVEQQEGQYNSSRASSGRKCGLRTGQRSHLTYPFWSRQESGFHCRCGKKSQEGFEMGSYFSVKNSLDVMGRREARKAARGQLEGAPVFQVRGDGALDQGNSSGVVHGGGGGEDNGEADLTGLGPVHEGHKRRRL